MKNPVILFRKDYDKEEEFRIASSRLPVYESRDEIPSSSIVICRYSSLPYYDLLEQSLNEKGSQLINTYKQHLWVNDISQWYPVVKDYTFTTWFDNFDSLPSGKAPFIVKGVTNSRKHEWKEKMFAPTKERALEILSELKTDCLFDNQDIVIRRYQKLKTLIETNNGLPIVHEWRFFFYGKQLLESGFYWSEYRHLYKTQTPFSVIKLAQDVANIVKDYVNFFTVDVAEKDTGHPVLVELGDAQMSGLTGCASYVLYTNLKNKITGKGIYGVIQNGE